MNAVRSHRTRNLLVTAALVIAAATVFGLRYRQLGNQPALASIRSVQEQEGVPVETVPVRRDDIAQWITLAGTVEGEVQYPIVSNNALKVVGIPVREGDRVEKGDVIIRLATGAPSPMFHSLDKSRASHAEALVDVRRLRNLYEAGAVAKAELDAAETRLKVLAADLQDAEGSSALCASEGGVVTSILVREGETVKGGDPLAWIADTGRVKIAFAAGSNQALALAAGQLARWTAPDGSGRDGTIGKLDLMADPKTHLLAGEAEFDNGDGRLVPGLLVSFRVRTGLSANTLAVPAACLVAGTDGPAVWVADGTARQVPVEVGLRTADLVEIRSGLTEGQQAVVYGQTLLSQGAKVRPVGAGEGR